MTRSSAVLQLPTVLPDCSHMFPRAPAASMACGIWIPGWCALPFAVAVTLLISAGADATPANKAAFEKHYDRFLARELNRCTTCHLPSDKKAPESLQEFPHNPFGHRLRL